MDHYTWNGRLLDEPDERYWCRDCASQGPECDDTCDCTSCTDWTRDEDPALMRIIMHDPTLRLIFGLDETGHPERR